MKITIIHGSPRKGNTYAAIQRLKNEMAAHGAVTFTEFFLPQDLPAFCKGCFLCLSEDEKRCPHAQYTLPIADAMLDADGLIFTTPVYVLQATGAVKAFLDHFSWLFIVHRARPAMFGKKALVLSTTAGAGAKAAIKTITTSLKFWGVNKIYTAGFAMRAGDWETVQPKRRAAFERKLKKLAGRFFTDIASGKRCWPYLLINLMFYFRRSMLKKEAAAQGSGPVSADLAYWQAHGWFDKNPLTLGIRRKK
ncbi:MAG: NAD(P)H-dependent oxidoreductase [Defluviitaleaceae bacterium]|nr:NAD(P)H-dependent oxidoreductase [Defluviitaleaceae bacterium]